MNFYNENDPKAAAWLRELMKARHIPEGKVDERSIADIQPDDIYGLRQAHFFAGIGGWPYALALAGWPEDREVWTGSCPCQPFSAAGKQRGTADDRHLWPDFRRLIAECRPATIFGEQVASRLGREWLAGVFADLEGLGYAVAGADLCAASVSAPHIRQRLFWVADASNERHRIKSDSAARRGKSSGSVIPLGLANTEHDGRRTDEPRRGQEGREVDGRAGRVVQSNGTRREPGQPSTTTAGHGSSVKPAGSWDRYAIVHCLDGKARRFEPESFPLAHGVSGRVGLLRGYGNAIVPACAAAFIKAFIADHTKNPHS